MKCAETVIVGGGPAGAAAACCLAMASSDVMLIERSGAAHHKVCGEFLSVETQELVRALGIDLAALGAASVDRLGLNCGARAICTGLPFRALSLSRMRLDAALLRRAEECGAQVQRNVAARRFEQTSNGWALHLSNGAVVGCRHLVVATGKCGLYGVKDGRDTSRVGLKIHLRLSEDATRAITNFVHLYFLDNGYAGLELVEDRIANLCVLIDQKSVPLRGTSWSSVKDYLAACQPRLGEYLATSEPLWEKPKAVACPTGGYLYREDDFPIYRVGDRIAHIPPFTGDGLAIALSTGVLAATHIRDGRSSAHYHAAARRLTASSIRVASLVAVLMGNKPIRTALLASAGYWPRLVDVVVERTRLPHIN